jgi:hypothetical protein
MIASAIRSLASGRESHIIAAAFVEKTVQIWDVAALRLVSQFDTVYDFGGEWGRLTMAPKESWASIWRLSTAMFGRRTSSRRLAFSCAPAKTMKWSNTRSAVLCLRRSLPSTRRNFLIRSCYKPNCTSFIFRTLLPDKYALSQSSYLSPAFVMADKRGSFPFSSTQ